MNQFDVVSSIQAYRERCEDRLAVINDQSRTVIVVADGAGGTGCGELAAQTVVDEVKAAFRQIHSAREWVELLRQIDVRIGEGESTAVVVDLRPFGIAGASVGDSRAIIVDDGSIDELTSKQQRKPLLGSGDAEPTGFSVAEWKGVLLVGTDGFFNYAKPERICELVVRSDFVTLPRRCIDLVRLPSGEYWDDIAIVAVQAARRRSTKQRYTINQDD
jgi:serine/threonine protein phosphatase PrpC